jgi:plasmid stability protein
MMGALTVRNIPDDIHSALKALATKHGRSAEAEVRDMIAHAVKPQARILPGDALSSIWKPLALTDAEIAAVESVRSRDAAKPINLG